VVGGGGVVVVVRMTVVGEVIVGGWIVGALLGLGVSVVVVVVAVAAAGSVVGVEQFVANCSGYIPESKGGWWEQQGHMDNRRLWELMLLLTLIKA
jgi:hypothetical protein